MQVQATTSSSATVDPRSGYCPSTRSFRSVRPPAPLPPPGEPLSVTGFSLSLLRSLALPPSHALFVDASTGASLPLHLFLARHRSLSAALRSPPFNLSRGHVAFVLSPSRLEVPLLYLSLLSLGVAVCPSNPACTPREVARQLRLASPSLAFVTSATAHLLPPGGIIPSLLLDSPSFQSLLHRQCDGDDEPVEVRQDDTAVVLFSSGTTGPPKAAAASHRNYIAMIAGSFADEAARRERERVVAGEEVMLLTAPLFHSLGCFVVMKGAALGETTLLVDRPSLGEMVGAAARYGATTLTATPPVVAALSKAAGSEKLGKLRRVFCGGAPLHGATVEGFRQRFPWVNIEQAYGITEGGGIARMINAEECNNYKSVGKLNTNVEVKVVDPASGEALPVGRQGELWLGGPSIMKGYLGDEEANALIFSKDGWLKSGDLGYIDNAGYLYIVDRLKELIKYKAYQVAPSELELLLQTFPEIDDAAVIPYPSKDVGEVPLAFVVRRPGSDITESQIMLKIAKEVAPYKKIRRVKFICSIPRNPSGKILRKKLVSRAISKL